jgi:pyruvate carboxylase
VYELEMPGGQYTNLFQQAKALGLASRWHEVCKAYVEVNLLFGDIIKVTPSSKVVGDMAIFLVANDLTSADTLDPERELAFPESVVEFFQGRLGQPPGGFPAKLQDRVLKGRPVLTGRPGANLPSADLEGARAKASALLGCPATLRDGLSYVLYPRVFPELATHERTYSDTSILPTPTFFFGPEPGEEIALEIEQGKTLIVKLLAVGEPHTDGKRTVFFELNGQPREVEILDRSLASSIRETPKADPADPDHVGAPLPGLVVGVAVALGDRVRKGQKLLSIEAMKMETTLYAERPGRVAEVIASVGLQVKAGDLLLKITRE